MAQEIERKFLVKGDFKQYAHAALRITQGYLSSIPQCTVRVRTKGDKGYITIKGQSNPSGVSRYEWEKEIPVDEAHELLKLCKTTIDKTRYLVDVGDHTFEVDEFHGSNEGILLAEVELKYEDEPFEKPDWLGEEVTGNCRYYNSYIASNPAKLNKCK